MDGRARIAWNVRQLRGERGLSQEVLAADAGVAMPYVSSIERGLANPTIDVLDKLARVLGVEVHELLIRPDRSRGRPKPLRAGRKPKTEPIVR